MAVPTAPLTAAEQLIFVRRIERDPSGCWLWRGALNLGGYGRFGRHRMAHKAAYQTVVGEIPEGLVLDHFVCSRRECVNPRHLRPVSRWENALRGETVAAKNLAKTECPRGHAYDEVNTGFQRTGRYCRACSRDRSRAWRQAISA